MLDGDGARVIEYCKLDTVETLLVFLVWGHHCGWVARERLRELVENLRGVLVKETFEGWRDVAQSLSGWPSWAAA